MLCRLYYAATIRDLSETSFIEGFKGGCEMEYKLSKAEARLLVCCSQRQISENYADALGVKLNMNSSYVAGLLRRLEIAGYLTIVQSGKRRLIENVAAEALECSKNLLKS